MMEFKPFPKVPRLDKPIVITEKLDGTNAAVVVATEPFPQAFAEVFSMKDGVLSTKQKFYLGAQSRTRFIKPEDDNYGFAKWVKENSLKLAGLGEGMHFGEWWGSGIQRGYGLSEKRFSLFNVGRWHGVLDRPACCHSVPVLASFGSFDSQIIEDFMVILKREGSMAAPGFMDPEGIMIFHSGSNSYYKKTFEDAHKGILL